VVITLMLTLVVCCEYQDYIQERQSRNDCFKYGSLGCVFVLLLESASKADDNPYKAYGGYGRLIAFIMTCIMTVMLPAVAFFELSKIQLYRNEFKAFSCALCRSRVP